MRTLNADCHAAVGAHARIDDGVLHLIGMFEVNERIVVREIAGSPHESKNLGQRHAESIFHASSKTL